MSGDMMSFPDNWWTFVQQYQFADKDEVYINGSMLIPSFRVRQMVEHYFGGEVGKPKPPCSGGKLTAEQVREAIFNGSVYASYDGTQYYASGINIQAIADELNATLGGGECEIVYRDGGWYCTECKEAVGCDDPWCESYINGNVVEMWSFCPACGRRLRR